MPQARAACLIARELGMTADVALHLRAGDAELMRGLIARAPLRRHARHHCPAPSPGILATLEAMRPFLDQAPAGAALR